MEVLKMKLIINADDFGCTVPVSLGIIEGMRYGMVSSTSAIVPAPDFLYCAKYALEHGLCHMGLHSMLTMISPTLPVSQVPSLVDERGMMYDRNTFLKKEVNIHEAEAELENQIRIFRETGLRLDHIDTHHGLMQKNAAFTELFLHLAHKYHVPLRNEFSRRQGPNTSRILKEVKNRNIPMTDILYFNQGKPYHTTEDIILFLEQTKSRYEAVEIGCHPGHSDDYLRSVSVLNDDREKELDVMLDVRLRNYIRENRIEVISYDQL